MTMTTIWLQAVASYQCLPGFYNYGYGETGPLSTCSCHVIFILSENTSVVYSSCQLNGTWTSVTLTCMAGPGYPTGDWINIRAANDSSVFTITEEAPSRAFSWLKATSSASTLKTLLIHYAQYAK